MRLEQLLYVVEVADARQINVAANKLFVTSQNISKAIKQLEKELGILIFDRTKYGMSLTTDGQLVYNVAKDILKQTYYLGHAFVKDAKDANAEVEGPLNILAPVAMMQVLHNLLRPFIEAYRGVRITYKEEESSEILRAIDTGDVGDTWDMVFLSVAKKDLGDLARLSDRYDAYILKEESMCVLMSGKSRYANQQSISLKTLATLPIVAFSSLNAPDSGQASFVDQVFKEYGIRLNVVYTSNAYHTWYSYIAEGVAYGVVGSDFMRNYADDRGRVPTTVTVPLKERITTTNTLLIPKERPESLQRALFLKSVHRHYGQHMVRL